MSDNMNCPTCERLLCRSGDLCDHDFRHGKPCAQYMFCHGDSDCKPMSKSMAKRITEQKMEPDPLPTLDLSRLRVHRGLDGVATHVTLRDTAPTVTSGDAESQLRLALRVVWLILGTHSITQQEEWELIESVGALGDMKPREVAYRVAAKALGLAADEGGESR